MIWESDNPTAFSVDKNGKVTCKTNSGSAWITARIADGTNMEADIYVTAANVMKSIELKNAPSTISLPTEHTVKYGMKLLTQAGGIYAGYDVAISVNKEGLIVWSDEYNQIHMTGEKIGTYKVTLSLKDGNTTKKTYTVKVW